MAVINPIPIYGIICIFSGGELISQRYGSHIFLMSVHADFISISLVTSTNHVDVRVPSTLLDNRWHTIEFIHKMGSLKFLVDRRETLIANSTYNTLFLTDAPNDDSAILIIGASYSGCMLQGPGINFSSVAAKDIDSVQFGPCPIIQGPCMPNNMIIRPQNDQCLHDPCMSHGACTSKADTYEVCYLTIKLPIRITKRTTTG